MPNIKCRLTFFAPLTFTFLPPNSSFNRLLILSDTVLSLYLIASAGGIVIASPLLSFYFYLLLAHAQVLCLPGIWALHHTLHPSGRLENVDSDGMSCFFIEPHIFL
ncbi:hypothetical protein, partial [Candidatus Hakubella thermalkaliphila]|uniref:hypothetical protein n=1 Tax=Candidatus Hakubella thermalkaliphila TaxID=2754717 RepID=UPI001C613115